MPEYKFNEGQIIKELKQTTKKSSGTFVRIHGQKSQHNTYQPGCIEIFWCLRSVVESHSFEDVNSCADHKYHSQHPVLPRPQFMQQWLLVGVICRSEDANQSLDPTSNQQS